MNIKNHNPKRFIIIISCIIGLFMFNFLTTTSPISKSVIALGCAIDLDVDNNVILSVQAYLPTQDSNNQYNSYTLYQSKGKTITQAVGNLDKQLGRSVVYEHMVSMIIAQPIFDLDFFDQLLIFYKQKKLLVGLQLFATPSNANKLFVDNNMEDTCLSLHLKQITLQARSQAIFPTLTLRDYLNNHQSKNSTIIMPLLTQEEKLTKTLYLLDYQTNIQNFVPATQLQSLDKKTQYLLNNYSNNEDIINIHKFNDIEDAHSAIQNKKTQYLLDNCSNNEDIKDTHKFNDIEDAHNAIQNKKTLYLYDFSIKNIDIDKLNATLCTSTTQSINSPIKTQYLLDNNQYVDDLLSYQSNLNFSCLVLLNDSPIQSIDSDFSKFLSLYTTKAKNTIIPTLDGSFIQVDSCSPSLSWKNNNPNLSISLQIKDKSIEKAPLIQSLEYNFSLLAKWCIANKCDLFDLSNLYFQQTNSIVDENSLMSLYATFSIDIK